MQRCKRIDASVYTTVYISSANRSDGSLLEDCLPRTQTLGFIPRTITLNKQTNKQKLCLFLHVFNSSSRKVELEVTKFKASVGQVVSLKAASQQTKQKTGQKTRCRIESNVPVIGTNISKTDLHLHYSRGTGEMARVVKNWPCKHGTFDHNFQHPCQSRPRTVHLQRQGWHSRERGIALFDC